MPRTSCLPSPCLLLGVLSALALGCGGGGGSGGADSGPDAPLADSSLEAGSDGELPASGDCDPSGAVGLQATPGFKSEESDLVPMDGELTLEGETITGRKITGTVRGYGTIKDSWVATNAFVAVQNDSEQPLILEDVTIGGADTYGDLAVASEGSGGVVLRRVRVEGYADCFRNGPFDIENSWCTTTAQSPDDHNDGYQAYMAGEVEVSIRCSQIDNDMAHPTAGIFHADGSQVRFILENLEINMNANYCIRLHQAEKFDELPEGDTTDDGRVVKIANIECNTGGEGVWIDGLPIDEWSNVRVNGDEVSAP